MVELKYLLTAMSNKCHMTSNSLLSFTHHVNITIYPDPLGQLLPLMSPLLPYSLFPSFRMNSFSSSFSPLSQMQLWQLSAQRRILMFFLVAAGAKKKPLCCQLETSSQMWSWYVRRESVDHTVHVPVNHHTWSNMLHCSVYNRMLHITCTKWRLYRNHGIVGYFIGLYSFMDNVQLTTLCCSVPCTVSSQCPQINCHMGY